MSCSTRFEIGPWRRRQGRTGCVLATLAVLCGLACAPASSDANSEGERIVTVGGALTEIVFALGAGESVVGVDTSSSYPSEVTYLPTVGSHRRVSAESVLALQPTLVLASSRTPGTAVDQLRAAGVAVRVFDDVETLAGAGERIRAVTTTLDRVAAGEALATKLTTATADQANSSDDNGGATRPRVLFIYARGTRLLMVAGRDTSAEEVVRLAGGRNAITGFTGFRPLSAEAVVAAEPDVLLMMTSGVASLQGEDSVFDLPGVALTPAGRHRRLIAMNGLLLLGFGPRTADAIAALRAHLQRVMTEVPAR